MLIGFMNTKIAGIVPTMIVLVSMNTYLHSAKYLLPSILTSPHFTISNSILMRCETSRTGNVSQEKVSRSSVHRYFVPASLLEVRGNCVTRQERRRTTSTDHSVATIRSPEGLRMRRPNRLTDRKMALPKGMLAV